LYLPEGMLKKELLEEIVVEDCSCDEGVYDNIIESSGWLHCFQFHLFSIKDIDWKEVLSMKVRFKCVHEVIDNLPYFIKSSQHP